MDCIDLFKKAAAALQTDPRYLELDAARRENDQLTKNCRTSSVSSTWPAWT